MNAPNATATKGDHTPKGTSEKTIFDIIKDYKELLAAIGLVLAAILWIAEYFATKQQLKELHCLLNANVTLVQDKIEVASLRQLLVENINENAAIDKKASRSASDLAKANRLKIAAEELTRKIVAIEGSTTKALEKLKSGECSGSLRT